MKKMLMMLAAALVLPCAAGTILLDNPKNMNRTMKGDPGKSWVVWRSAVVPAKPNTWYRASVEIKTALKRAYGMMFHTAAEGSSQYYGFDLRGTQYLTAVGQIL